VAEVVLLQARAKREGGELDAASSRIAMVAAWAVVSEAADLRARLDLQRGLLAAAQGDDVRACEMLDRALASAADSHERALEAEVEQELSRATERRGTTFLAARHRTRAQEAWERIQASLPPELHDVFWAHPLRARLSEARAPAPATAASEDSKRLRRLLSINRKLNSTLDVKQVLEWTMDAAIDLSGAERGFLLTPRRGRAGFEVAVARNVDRERIGKSHLKFSRSIAERVVREARPVVTVDAGQDPRFRTNRSVHAMQLKAVCAVPVLSPSGVLGAIYLDNRFRAGGFDEEHLEILSAFADQAALALRNAQLYADLQDKTQKLEQQGVRLEELLADQTQRAEALSEELENQREVTRRRFDFGSIVGESEAMKQVFAQLDRVVDTPVTVMLQGESGTGKELVARAIHLHSDRREGRFSAINCAALPEQLLEAELFGHDKGAFTGADKARPGLFVDATGGTLFLDELGELPASIQAKLLRVLQERVVRPLGTSRSVPFDVRLVCATNRNLKEEVHAGRFREDLYFRLAVVTIALPALRERRDDIPRLALHLLPNLAEKAGVAPPSLSRDAMRLLCQHDWPGNVRQLENALLRACLMADEGTIHAYHLDLDSGQSRPRTRVTMSRAEEEAAIRRVLEETGWHVRRAAALFGVSRATFYRKLDKHGISRPVEKHA